MKNQVYIQGSDKLNVQQSSILVKSFLHAGIGFFTIAAFSLVLGVLWVWIFKKYCGLTEEWWENEEIVNKLFTMIVAILCTAIGLMIFSLILYYIWRFRIYDRSLGFNITVWTFYIISQSVGFSIVVSLFSAQFMVYVFGIGAIICFIVSLIGWYTSKKAAMTLTKISIFTLIISFLAAIALFCATIIMVINNKTWTAQTIINILYFGIGAVFTLLTMIAIIVQISNFKRSNEFSNISQLSQSHPNMTRQMISLFSMELLIKYIMLVWLLLRFAIALRSLRFKK